jgi:hypothetical protein
MHYLEQNRVTPGFGVSSVDIWDPNYLTGKPSRLLEDAFTAEADAQRLGPEMNLAIREFNAELKKLQELQRKVIRPEWPTEFDPVDPNGPEAEKPMDHGPAPISAPAEERSDVPGKALPPHPRP